MRVSKSIISIAVCFFLNLCLYSQELLQQQVDSLEDVFYNLNNTRISELVKVGETIISNSKSDIQKYYVLGYITNAFALQNDKEGSIPYIFRAKDIAEQIDNPELIVRANVTIASIYAALNLNNKAEKYLKMSHSQVARLPEGNKKYDLWAMIYSETGNIHYNNVEYRQANTNYRESLRYYNLIAATDSTILHSFYYQAATYNTGKSFAYIHQPDSALFYLNRALEIKNHDQPYLQYYIRTTISEVHSYMGDYERSIQILTNILLDSAFDVKELKAEIYLDLADLYRELGDTVNCSLYNEKYVSLSQQLQNLDVHAIDVAIEAEESQFKNSLSISQKHNSLLLASTTALAFLCLGVVYVFYRMRRKEQLSYLAIKEKQQSKKEERLSEIEDPGIKITQDFNRPGIDKSIEDEILKKLDVFEQTGQYKDQRLTLPTLATKFKTNTTYLSQIINRQKGKNYNSYVNELRIHYICQKIQNEPHYLNYKISYLAEDCGFNSHSAFTTVFKNVVGISPSVFLKKVRKEN